MTEKFTLFWSGPFSNWEPSPFVLDKVKYGCAEQYFMAEKARLFNDAESERLIMATNEPGVQKKLGRKVKGFDLVRWHSVARGVMFRASMAKYTQNPDLLTALLATAGTTLVEASPYDTIWGIGLAADDPRARSRSTWLGKNWLGETLTKVRDQLMKEGA